MLYKQTGTSDPIIFANLYIVFFFNLFLMIPLIIAAESAEPPPRPADVGIFLFKIILKFGFIPIKPDMPNTVFFIIFSLLFK